MIKLLEQVDPALTGPLVCFQVTVAQIRRRETPIQQVGYSNPEHLKFFSVEFLLHDIGILIETVAALLVGSVSKIK